MARTNPMAVMVKESIFDDLTWWSLGNLSWKRTDGRIGRYIVNEREKVDGEGSLCSLVNLWVEHLGTQRCLSSALRACTLKY
jgi:hypothetical protein